MFKSKVFQPAKRRNLVRTLMVGVQKDRSVVRIKEVQVRDLVIGEIGSPDVVGKKSVQMYCTDIYGYYPK